MSATETKVELKQLLEAGVHFGHQTNRWNPKMKKFIFGEKNGIYIIDLEKTKQYLEKAREFLRDVARAGSYVLFVGTKKQAQNVVKESAEKTGMFFVNQRWLGGTLTNFMTIRKSINKLDKLERSKVDGTYNELSKKEKAVIDREIEKLMKNLAGIRGMDRLPGAVYIIDTKNEETAVREAKKLSIPIVALIDTNSDPNVIDYPIPGNDDALKAINLVTSLMTESVLDGVSQFKAGSQIKIEEAKSEPIDEGVDETEVEELLEGDIRLKEAERVKDQEENAPKKKKKPLKN